MNTQIQWTMKLSDAGLIRDVFEESVRSAESAAEYLESDRYAATQAAALAEREHDMPKNERTTWALTDADKARIVDYRAKAARLRVLLDQ